MRLLQSLRIGCAGFLNTFFPTTFKDIQQKKNVFNLEEITASTQMFEDQESAPLSHLTEDMLSTGPFTESKQAAGNW